MTFNWGHKITLVFIAFGVLIISLVYGSFSTKIDLVSKEYYKEELAYQQVIDGTNNANALQSQTTVTLENGVVSITLPGEMKGRNIKGTVLFYCPIDASYDRKYDLGVSGSGTYNFPAKDLKAARYMLKISWTAGEVRYYSEEPVIIP